MSSLLSFLNFFLFALQQQIQHRVLFASSKEIF
jgi:hypothetical protein